MDIKSVSTEKKSKEGIPTLPGGFFKRKPIIADPKVGRNQLCPCGSKRKYKKCCLKKNAIEYSDSVKTKRGNGGIF